jgi:hypothetical protein
MTTVARFEIPESFVIERARPSPAELAYGFLSGWLGATSVISIAEVKHKEGRPLSPQEAELVLLLPDDLDRVNELCEAMAISDEPAESRQRLWMYLALAWLLEHRADFPDPLGVIETLFADFEYPDELSPLVRFMPVESGAAVGIPAIEDRWRDFVERVSREYAARDHVR